jgi:hypothetical protein
MKAKYLAAALGISAMMAGGAFAQGSLIEVNVSNVANNIAKNISVDVSQVPVTVKVPVDVAATVCGVAVTALGEATNTTSCKATTTSTALDSAVLTQIKGTTQG